MSDLIEKIIINKVNMEVKNLMSEDYSESSLLPYGTVSEEIKKYLNFRYPDLDIADHSVQIEKKLNEEEKRINLLEKEIKSKIKSSLVNKSNYQPNITTLHTVLNAQYMFEVDSDTHKLKELLCSTESINFVESRTLQNAYAKMKSKFKLGKKIISVMGAA